MKIRCLHTSIPSQRNTHTCPCTCVCECTHTETHTVMTLEKLGNVFMITPVGNPPPFPSNF